MRRRLAQLCTALLIACTFTPATLYAEPPASPRSASRVVKGLIRERIVRAEDLQKYGLRLDQECLNRLQVNEHSPLVVLVHGYNSKTERSADFFAALRKHDLPCATFNYPNDHALDESARLLSRELKALRKAHPERKVALVTHSMGGLVARACVENPALNPKNVERLVMIAPPTHGTLLAHFSLGTDLCEHFLKWRGGGPVARVRASIADGLGEAVEDLRPDSPFLTALNARSRNPDVQYTIFLGTGGRIAAWEMAAARRMIGYTRKLPYMRKYVDRLDKLLADMDEVLFGLGDGVVAVKRGRLAGVKDIAVFPFGHVSVTGPADSHVVAHVHQAVITRLTATRSQP